ncbi:uncharacterized protein [Typha latifolia]|uniref:uncharacterized protein n=1 Tax=Typha latifolia TaxID=4733 RepID=UPI003C2C309E
MSKSSMKSSSKTTTRVHVGGRGSAAEGGDDSIVIRFPGTLLLLVVARSVLVAVALLSFPWLRPAILSFSCTAAAAHPTAAVRSSRWINEPFYLPMLLRDLQRKGLLIPGSRAVFLGDASSRLPILKQHKMVSVSPDRDLMLPDRSVDFVLSADGFGHASFVFVDRVLKLGGVAVARLSSDPSYSFYLPPNYKMGYVRRFGSTIVAIKKTANSMASSARRRLLTIPEEKKEALNGLEDALLEPPLEITKHRKLHRRTRFLPDLIKDSLRDYPRRVFVDVGSPGKARSEKWFERNYPRKNSEFEIIRLDAVEKGRKAAAHGISDWLRKNVKDEEFVVMKAEAEVVEEMVESKAIGLVDELFFECRNQWQKGKRSRRAYWECLALYGKLRDEGVAVHQWWG